MLLLHVLVGLLTAAALILLASRVALWHVGRRAYNTPDSARRGARSNDLAPFLWIGPVIVARQPGAESEWVCDRFHGEEGPARTVGIVLGGVQVTADMHHHTARLWLLSPYFALTAWLGWNLGDVTSLDQAVSILLLLVLTTCVAKLVRSNDVLATDLHYAHSGAELGEHEAYARGANDGIRYETERRRFQTGERYDSPAYPANPYAA